jgi:hypothetical protein
MGTLGGADLRRRSCQSGKKTKNYLPEKQHKLKHCFLWSKFHFVKNSKKMLGGHPRPRIKIQF